MRALAAAPLVPFALSWSLLASPATAQSMQAILVAQGLERPTSICAPPDGTDRLFVTLEKRGVVIVKDGTVLPTRFLDLDGEIGLALTGLTSLAFHPDYAENGRFFVVYQNTDQESLVVEYEVSADPDLADPSSAKVLLGPFPQPHTLHNWNCLAFAPDGTLYVSTGDGGPGVTPPTTGQDLTTPLGKILRIDVDLPAPHIPPDNPFVGVPGADERIWAYGLRQPWRIAFDALTGDLWITDVGWNTREEIDFQPATSAGGENYGWRCMEGTECTHLGACGCDDAEWVEPIYDYPTHAGGNCCVIGGHVYRGAALPGLQGAYVFGDNCSARVWSFRYDGVAISDFRDWSTEVQPCGGSSLDGISSFGVDAAGELYVLDVFDGEVYKLVPNNARPYCTAKESSAGCLPTMRASGTPTLSGDDDFFVLADDVPGQTTALLLWGLSANPPPHTGPGSPAGASPLGGRYCVLQPESWRVASSGGTADACDGTFQFHFSHARMKSEELVAGTTVYTQFWYSDPGHPDGTGVGHSDALEFTVCE